MTDTKVNWADKTNLVDDILAEDFNDAFKSIQEGFDNTKKEIDENIPSVYAKKSELPTKESLGLDKVDNTPDSEKSVAWAENAASADNAHQAESATHASCDMYKNLIHEHYASKEELSSLKDALLDGSIRVAEAAWAERADDAEIARKDVGGWDIDTTTYATKSELNTAVGDIETALDNIIAIQNTLIGGESA